MVKTSQEEDNITNKNTSALFNSFVHSKTCGDTFASFLELCHAINLDYPPCSSSSAFTYEHLTFYPRFKKKLSTWKANAIWAKLDKRFNGKEYYSDAKSHHSKVPKAGEDLKVLVIGAGPCGLRTAIELACLGSKVVVLEKRESFLRNNILHLWPYLITDLKSLGAKKFYGRFCAGSLDHISIRQLQLILLKIALVLGVEVVFNVTFSDLIPPVWDEKIEEAKKGWTAEVNPSNHPITNYEFDVVIGADGKRNTLKGFKRKERRGKLAIGLTVNFIHRNTTAEAKVEEISGVAYIFNQEFFKNLHNETGIDLENIVYYKGETHYFVMTAKKHSLLTKGVLKQDFDDIASLLSRKNVDQNSLMQYTKEAANFSTHNQLPNLEFAYNQYGQADVALFDFTCMYAAENAAMFREEKGCKLLACLVGDSLLEPFWPTGTGCARGFLASFDATWMIKQWNLKREDGLDCTAELEVLAERESIYRLLHQTKPENMLKKTAAYTIDPKSRYVHLNKSSVKPHQVVRYYLSDRDIDVIGGQVVQDVGMEPDTVSLPGSNLTRKVSMVRSNKLLTWCQTVTKVYEGVEVLNLSSSWRSGLPLCAIIHRFRPDLIDWSELKPEDIETNNQLAFNVAEEQLGITPVMTGKEMASCQEVDKLLMLTYLSQFYEIFKYETPAENLHAFEAELQAKSEAESPPKSPHKLSLTSPIGLLVRFTQHIKRRSSQKKHDQSKRKKSDGSSGSDVVSPDDKLPVVQEVEEEIEENIEVPPVMMIGGAEVKLRPKMSPGGTIVHQRACDRISALSNQLISQWQQNSPDVVSVPVKRQVDISDIPISSSSNQCYFCSKRLHVFERMSAEGVFFHRNCFRCSHCGITLRQGSYIFVENTGSFFCHKSCVVEAETCTVVTPTAEGKSFDVQGDVTDSAGPHQASERIELENIRMSMLNDPEELPEEDVARHNFVADISEEESLEETISVSSDADSDDSDDDDIDDDSDDIDDDSDDIDDDWKNVPEVSDEGDFREKDSLQDSDDSIASLADISTDTDSSDVSDISLADISTPSSDQSDASLADISTDEDYVVGNEEMVAKSLSSASDQDHVDAEPKVGDNLNNASKMQIKVLSTRSLSSSSSKSSASNTEYAFDTLRSDDVILTSSVQDEAASENVGVDIQVRSIGAADDYDQTSERRLPPQVLDKMELSSESGSMSSSGCEIDEDAVLELLEEKEGPSNNTLKITKSLKKAMASNSTDQDTDIQSKPSTRVLPKLPLNSSVLIKAASTPERQSDISQLQTKPNEDVEVRSRPSLSLNESMLASYKNTPGLHHPLVERKHSFDSLERRLQLRLHARNRWLSEDANFGTPLKRSQSDRRPRSPRFVDKQTKSASGTPTKKSFDAVSIAATPPAHAAAIRTALPIQTTIAWQDASKVSEGESRDIPIVSEINKASPTSSESQEIKTKQLTKKRSLPRIPPVVASPVGIEDDQEIINEEVKIREKIVKEKFERMKAKSLRKKTAVSKEEDNITDVDGARITSFSASTIDSSKGARVKRSLPTPKEMLAHVSSEEKTSPTEDAEKTDIKDTCTSSHQKDVATERKMPEETDKSDRKKKMFFQISPRKKLAKEKRKKSQEDVEESGKASQGDNLDLPTTSKKISSESNSDESKSKQTSRRKLPRINIRAKIKRKAEVAARRQAKLESQQRLHRAQTIQRSLEEVEVKQRTLEERGVQLENLLRSVEDEAEESQHMQEWFKLVQEKNALLRYENELMIKQRELQLEDDQSRLQQKLRAIMALDDKRKTAEQLSEEKQILQKMLEVVDQRDELRAILEEQKIKERDESLNVETVMLKNFDSSSKGAAGDGP